MEEEECWKHLYCGRYFKRTKRRRGLGEAELRLQRSQGRGGGGLVGNFFKYIYFLMPVS